MALARNALPKELAELEGTTIAGAYRVGKVLGSGSMGVVFEGEQLKLKRPIAIKVIDPELASSYQATRRFRREAESVARLDHPNCLRVYDFGTTDNNLHFMVMPLLDGRPLQRRYVAGLSPRRALELIEQVFAGLTHAHQQGLVHRDLKPSNILLVRSEDGEQEIAKIVDFGIAKVVDDEASFRTRTGMLCGTPAYMSPEQAVGDPLDARSDIYSVGLVLYWLLSGDVPHRTRYVVDQLRKRATLDVPPLPSPCPPEINALVSWLCAVELDKRCPDASAARERIATLLESAPASPEWDEPLPNVLLTNAPGATIDAEGEASATEHPDSNLGTNLDMGASPTILPERRGAIDHTPLPTRVLDDPQHSTGGPRPGRAGTDTLPKADTLPHADATPPPFDTQVDDSISDVAPLEPLPREPSPEPDASEAEQLPSPAARSRWLLPLALGVGAVALVAWRLVPAGDSEPQAPADDATRLADATAPDVPPLRDDLPTEPEPAPEPEPEPEPEPSDEPPGPTLLDKLNTINTLDNAAALPFAERHALLDELRKNPSTATLIDETVNHRLDLTQAGTAEQPCETFLAALEALADSRDPELREAIRAATAPAGDGQVCARARRLLERLQARGKSKPARPSTATKTEPAESTGDPRPGEITPKLQGLD